MAKLTQIAVIFDRFLRHHFFEAVDRFLDVNAGWKGLAAGMEFIDMAASSSDGLEKFQSPINVARVNVLFKMFLNVVNVCGKFIRGATDDSHSRPVARVIEGDNSAYKHSEVTNPRKTVCSNRPVY
jgi:hypothetical protein